MIIKGRSPTIRHVSRTHKFALDWLFDRINLESKIQIKYVDQLAATRGLAPERVAALKSCWESNVVKSAPVQLAAHVRHSRAKPCKKSRARKAGRASCSAWTQSLSPWKGALEAALQLQKGVRKHGPAPRGPTDAMEVERLGHRVEQYSLRMGDVLRRGVLEPSMVNAFLMTKGGQQVPKSKAKARARSREMMSEGVEQTPDASPPRPLERPPIVFVRGETLEPSTARPKSANITEKPTAEYWGSCAGMTIFSSTWNRLHVFFFLHRENLHGPLCKDDTYILFWWRRRRAA